MLIAMPPYISMAGYAYKEITASSHLTPFQSPGQTRRYASAHCTYIYWQDMFHLTPADSLAEDGGPVLVNLNVNFHLPCVWPRDTSQTTAPSGVLHINPEYDFLQIVLGREVCSEQSHVIVDFIRRFKTVHDPRGVGFRNLVADEWFLTKFRPARWSIGESDEAQEPDRGQPPDAVATRAFRDTMAQLHEAFFLHVFHEGRTFCSPYAREGDPFVNQSYPIMTLATHFSRVARDPRPIGRDLLRIPMVTLVHPDELFKNWQILMASVGLVEPTAVGAHDEAGFRTEFHFLIAASPDREGPPIWPYDRQGGLICLQKEMDAFPSKCESRSSNGNMPEGFAERPQASRVAEQQQPTAIPVLGFWLFPLGTILPATENRLDWPLEEAVDLSGHWPTLGVFDFSSWGRERRE
ncbi:hypothetical protein GGTG_11313 [Gaeumannomyces tritici R3-111a-1]|uniref:Uncharacterized protein n=1 Tax=Gaeumannomyces tritici (strain R3-111a-1) TaxID=644352 RepID=J3PCU5_GAET3|nr:hypothetical protein GGTG_11313 [Gaeumannomyces tritici R3-111a-1]EJT72065.1 hypothetical protein GGTG_11313 [Gaeumannomyces tritici R3-111a-1]